MQFHRLYMAALLRVFSLWCQCAQHRIAHKVKKSIAKSHMLFQMQLVCQTVLKFIRYILRCMEHESVTANFVENICRWNHTQCMQISVQHLCRTGEHSISFDANRSKLMCTWSVPAMDMCVCVCVRAFCMHFQVSTIRFLLPSFYSQSVNKLLYFLSAFNVDRNELSQLFPNAISSCELIWYLFSSSVLISWTRIPKRVTSKQNHVIYNTAFEFLHVEKNIKLHKIEVKASILPLFVEFIVLRSIYVVSYQNRIIGSLRSTYRIIGHKSIWPDIFRSLVRMFVCFSLVVVCWNWSGSWENIIWWW